MFILSFTVLNREKNPKRSRWFFLIFCTHIYSIFWFSPWNPLIVTLQFTDLGVAWQVRFESIIEGSVWSCLTCCCLSVRCLVRAEKGVRDVPGSQVFRSSTFLDRSQAQRPDWQPSLSTNRSPHLKRKKMCLTGTVSSFFAHPTPSPTAFGKRRGTEQAWGKEGEL